MHLGVCAGIAFEDVINAGEIDFLGRERGKRRSPSCSAFTQGDNCKRLPPCDCCLTQAWVERSKADIKCSAIGLKKRTALGAVSNVLFTYLGNGIVSYVKRCSERVVGKTISPKETFFKFLFSERSALGIVMECERVEAPLQLGKRERASSEKGANNGRGR